MSVAFFPCLPVPDSCAKRNRVRVSPSPLLENPSRICWQRRRMRSGCRHRAGCPPATGSARRRASRSKASSPEYLTTAPQGVQSSNFHSFTARSPDRQKKTQNLDPSVYITSSDSFLAKDDDVILEKNCMARINFHGSHWRAHTRAHQQQKILDNILREEKF